MPGRPMTEEQKRKKRERKREQQNSIPVIAQNWWKKLLHKCSYQNCLKLNMDALFQVNEHFKNWSVNRFFLCSGMKLELHGF